MINWDLVTDKKSFIEQAKDVLPTIEIDSLTNYGASLLNRDRDGFAKRVMFGGVERGRISSQSIKYAVRQANNPGTFPEGMEPEDYIEHAKALTLRLLSSKKDHAFKVTMNDAESVAEAILQNFDPSKPIEEAEWGNGDGKKAKDSKVDKVVKALEAESKNRLNSSEVAMFGRMSTSDILRSVDGAVAMSHAFTTHEYNGDVDTFTAVDELKAFGFGDQAADENSRGAAGIWDVDLNAGCFYQYCNISTMIYALNMLDGMDFNDKEALKRRLDSMAKDISEFIKLYLLTAPVAMQNSKASFPGPSVVYIRAAVRPANHSYENAFAKPVVSDGEKDVVELSAKRLTEYIDGDVFFDNDYAKQYWLSDHHYTAPKGAQDDKNLKSVLSDLEEYIHEACD